MANPYESIQCTFVFALRDFDLFSFLVFDKEAIK